MFDLGIQELIVIFIVALIVFGPDKLPEIGTTIGRVFNDLKRSLEGVRSQINAGIHDIKDPLALKEHLYGDSASQTDTLIHPQSDPLKNSDTDTDNVASTPSDTTNQQSCTKESSPKA